jgi:hypothetical protein
MSQCGDIREPSPLLRGDGHKYFHDTGEVCAGLGARPMP